MKKIDGYDVVVVGGGPGGFAAAVAAGRAGARTLLLEREGCLGGGATTMLVHPFMSHLTRPAERGGPRELVNGGVFWELVQRLKARDATWINACVHFDDEIMKIEMDRMVGEAGVDVVFHAALYDAEADDDRVTRVLLAHNSGPLQVTGRIFIDGTGDALLAARAGCECEFGDDSGTVMPMTTNFRVGGVDPQRMPEHGELKKLAAAGGEDDPPLENTNLSTWGIWRRREHYAYFNAIRVPGDTLDPEGLSHAEIEGRRRVENFVQWLRARVPGFENCYLIKTGPHVGIRESRRVMGDYVLNGDDCLGCGKFEDAIACCSYMVDIHGQVPGQTRIQHLPPNEYYQIPYRCLTPRGKSNLLIAARSISADIVAHSSLRIMPPVMNIGTAAGMAAAMTADAGDVREIDVGELQKRIVAGGGVLDPPPYEEPKP